MIVKTELHFQCYVTAWGGRKQRKARWGITIDWSASVCCQDLFRDVTIARIRDTVRKHTQSSLLLRYLRSAFLNHRDDLMVLLPFSRLSPPLLFPSMIHHKTLCLWVPSGSLMPLITLVIPHWLAGWRHLEPSLLKRIHFQPDTRAFSPAGCMFLISL